MVKKIISFGLIISVFSILYTGCAKMYSSEEVSLYDVNAVYTYVDGTVVDVKLVKIRDDGSGAFTGAAIGTVLGSLFGDDRVSALTALIGGLTGAYVGSELGKANAEELYIKLDDGRTVVTVVKGLKIKKGDRVRLILDGNRIVRVEKLT